MKINFFKSFHEDFALRVFTAFAILICLISFSFTAFFINHESASLKDEVIKRGHLLSGILAHSVRIGVFSEDEKLLEDPVEGILHQEGVLGVAVFNLKGDLLKGVGEVERKSPRAISPYHLERRNTFQFFSPVVSGPVFSREDPLLLEGGLVKREVHPIGAVCVTLDKEILNKKLNVLLSRSILMGILFLLIGSAVTYLVVRGVTRPLNKLTEGVRALGRGGEVEKMSVEAKDEFGRLAKAFNDMSEALRAREDSLRESEHRLRSLSSQLMNAQEKERLRLSKELHDELGHSLALLKHSVRSIQTKVSEVNPSLHKECDEAIAYIGEIIENVRRLSRDLSPSILEDIGLSSALGWLIESVGKQYSLEASFDIDEIDQLFPKEAQTNLYRISQEALTNIVRHAQAKEVSFLAKRNHGSLSIVIEDNGKGFDLNEVKNRHHSNRGIGLDTMTERAHMLGGFFEIRTNAEMGTRITITIPIKRERMNSGTLPNCDS
jgi:signal transduction histidine kinase